MERKSSISIPYLQNYLAMRVMGPPIAVLGIWAFFFFLIDFWDAGIWFWLVCIWLPVFSAVMGVYGLKITFESFLMMHFVPEGIAVTLFDRELRLYPVEKIKTCYHRRGVNFNWIAVSCLDREDLAKRREEKLRRSVFSKSGVDYKMRRPHWKDWFARDQIKEESRKALRNPFGEDFFWMEFAPERREFLRGMYPQIPWGTYEDKTYSPAPPWKDEKEYVFCRGLCRESGRMGSFLLCAVFVVPFPAAVLFMPREPVGEFLLVLLSCGLLAALFLTLWHFGKAEYDELWLYPDRLRITRKNKDLEVIPAEEVRTILHGRFEQKGGPREFLAVSRFTEGELAGKIAEKCRSREKRMILTACRQLPEGDRLILAWYSGRWMAAGFYNIPNAQSLSHTYRRVEVLRQRYPGAKWVELT